MTNYNNEYFFLKQTLDLNIPSLKYDDDEMNDSMELFEEYELDTSEIRYLCFAKPIPSNPRLGDFLIVDALRPVISIRLKKLLESFKLKNVQFLPAIIKDQKGNRHEDYYIIHIYNLIECLDKEKSDWKPSERKPGKAFSIDKLVLNNELIDKIPLAERLIFAAWEHNLKAVYHLSMVDKLLEADPEEITAYRLSNWGLGVPLKKEYTLNK